MVDDRAVPMCTDLDGTLIAGDTLYEGILGLLRRNPLYALALPAWLFRGIAATKGEIAKRSPIDAGTLPYNTDFIALLREMHGHRPIVLCTAAHADYANAVARHLRLFDRVFATQTVNLDAHRKAEALVTAYGARGFDYAGDQSSDLAVFAVARNAFAVNATRRLRRRLPDLSNLSAVIDTHASRPVRTLFAALRVEWWIATIVMFLVLLGLQRVTGVNTVARAVGAFVACGLCASSVYLVDGLRKLETDRADPRGRRRPVASGALSIRSALILVPALLAAAMWLALAISKAGGAGLAIEALILSAML